MKAYTDLEQSKKLAEILPLESADMRFCYSHTLDGRITGHYPMIGREPSMGTTPCWSLAALLGVLPDSIYDNTDEFSQLEFSKKSVAYIQGTTDGIKIGALKDNLVDACYEMILKLHKLKML